MSAPQISEVLQKEQQLCVLLATLNMLDTDAMVRAVPVLRLNTGGVTYEELETQPQNDLWSSVQEKITVSTYASEWSEARFGLYLQPLLSSYTSYLAVHQFICPSCLSGTGNTQRAFPRFLIMYLHPYTCP
jgi:hypothetical protein